MILKNILYITEEPILRLGALGCFDDNGVSPLWIIDYEDTKYMYYLGWNNGSTVLASELTGLATSKDGGKTFKRLSRAPILKRTDMEPFSILVASCVLIENKKWRMWYDSADEWLSRDSSRYNIKYAESDDGIHWERMDDKAGLVLSKSGWDSEMVCYPNVFNHKGRKYMLYNGNVYGKTGFGYAIWEEE